MKPPLDTLLESMATHWAGLSIDRAPYGTGLINVTLAGRLADRRVIVQRVHPAFAASVHDDIEAITTHLERSGVLTPRLIRTDQGALCAVDEEGRAWRVLSFVEGSHSFDRIDGPARAKEAGRVVGRFHAALRDFEHEYLHRRVGIHDVSWRRTGLDAAIASHERHALHAEVSTLARELSRLASILLPVDVVSHRHAHGDLKTSNVLFDATGRGMCLVDLDTLATMAWPFELGDAIRSWCNPKREDEHGAHIDAELFRAALRGYRDGADGLELARAEVELLTRGVFTIACELAMRFLTDALEERYFSFDPARFESRGRHNLARATGQLQLARSIASEMAELERIARAEL